MSKGDRGSRQWDRLEPAVSETLLTALAERHAALDSSAPRELPERQRLHALIDMQFRTFIDELLQRVSADGAELAELVGADHPLRALSNVELGLSDPHGGGRSVVVLEFEGRYRAVYKPKDLRIAAWFLAQCERLEPVLPLPLHRRALIVRDGYGYEELVASAACADQAGVERYYLRIGCYLRLLEVLGGRDFHAENVRAAGEHPVLLDLETVVSAAGQPSPRVTAEQRAWQIRADSLLATGLVPDWEAGPRGAVDHSGLAIRPELAGKPDPIDRNRYLDFVIAGYMKTSDALRGAELDAELRTASGLVVRHIARPTPFYTALLERSLAPELLASEETRSAFLKGALGEGPLLEQELAALLRLDVPLFVAEVGSREVRELCADDAVAVLPEDPFAAIAERAERAPTPELIESAFATGPLARLDARMPAAEPVLADDAALLAAAREIGDSIVASAIEASGPALSWLGLVHMPAIEGRLLHRLPPDLLSGTAGVAIVLARLFAVMGDRRYAETAKRALQQSLRRLEVDLQEPQAGIEECLRAAMECGELLRDEGLRARAAEHAKRFTETETETETETVFARVRALDVAIGDGEDARARALAGLFLAHRASNGRYLPRGVGADQHNLSAITGIAALADAFLRIVYPGRFASLRSSTRGARRRSPAGTSRGG